MVVLFFFGDFHDMLFLCVQCARAQLPMLTIHLEVGFCDYIPREYTVTLKHPATNPCSSEDES